MRVYLVRHGIAADGIGYEEDGDRPLTLEGRQRARELFAQWAAGGDPLPTQWISSPLVRAVQTSELAMAALGAGGPLEISRRLLPETRVSAAAQLVDDRYGETLALVAHQPLLGGLAAFLLGLGTVPANLQPGAVLALDLPEDGDSVPRLSWHLRMDPDGKPRRLSPP